MKCVRCGQSIPSGGSFCSHCGMPLARDPHARPATIPPAASIPITGQPLQGAFDAQQRRNKAIFAGIVAAAVVAAAFLGFKAFGGLQAKGGVPDDPALVKRGKVEGGALQAQGNQPAPALGKIAERPAPKQMPPDVYAWLRHLEKCEAMKVEIAGDQSAEVSVWMGKMNALGAGMGMMNPYDQSSDDDKDQEPSGYAKGKILDLRPKWEQLIQYFNSVKPPEECQATADDYNHALGEIPGMMGDLGDILNGASTDPESALKTVKKIQNSSYGDIDRYFLRTDEKVSQICTKYETQKWFNVKGDVLAGGMMGKFSGLGGSGGIGMGGGL